MQRIIYKTAEGGVAIIIPTNTIEECMKDIPEGVEYKIVDVVDIPEDRTFRNAWEYAG
jgi:aspartate/glutamate racemase